MEKRSLNFFSIAALLIFMDQITKFLFGSFMVEGETKELVSGYLYITLSKSRGKIYQIVDKYLNFSNNFWITIIIALIILSYIAYTIEKEKVSKLQFYSYALIFANIFSDNACFLFRGYGFAFLDIRIFMPIITNLSGIYLFLAIIFIVLDSFFTE